ncbi:MAG: hypothetical protein ABIP30_10715 [Ferruginibacter sp.]
MNSFSIAAFASTAGGLRTCTGAAFTSFKKYATHFLNSDYVGTEPKEAPYTGTDKFSKLTKTQYLSPILGFIFYM